MLLPPALSTQVSMRNMEVVDDVCRSAVGCGGMEEAMVAFAVIAGLFTLLVLAAMVQLTDAISIVDEERERIAAERDAFAAFARRVAGLEPVESTAAVPAAGGLQTASPGRDAALDSVTDAYRETVMAVDHYAADYGEPLGANLAAELGEDLAVAVVDGDRFTPPLQSALVEASREASQHRAAFLRTLEDEATALAGAAERLEALEAERSSAAGASLTDRSFEELVAVWEELGEVADRVRTVAADRQAAIRSRSAAGTPGDLELHEYLYDSLPVTHPVLAEAARLLEGVETARSRVLRAITQRV